MGLSGGEVAELVEMLDYEVPILESLVKRYRSVSGAFLENEFPGGSDEVYESIPEKYRDLAERPPRYIDPPEVSPRFVESISDRAVYSVNFVDLRRSNIDCAVDTLEQHRYRVLDDFDVSLRAVDVLSLLEGYSEDLRSIEQSLAGVARLLDVSDGVQGKPFNDMKDLYQTGGEEDLKAAKRADPEDIRFPLESYWLFGESSTRTEQLN